MSPFDMLCTVSYSILGKGMPPGDVLKRRDNLPVRPNNRRLERDDIILSRSPIRDVYRRIHPQYLAHYLVEVWEGVQLCVGWCVCRHSEQFSAELLLHSSVAGHGVETPRHGCASC